MDRFSYLIRRLLLALPTFLGITLVCFALTRVLPGGPVEMRLARLRGLGSGEGGGAPAGRVAAITAEQVVEQMQARLGDQMQMPPMVGPKGFGITRSISPGACVTTSMFTDPGVSAIQPERLSGAWQ